MSAKRGTTSFVFVGALAIACAASAPAAVERHDWRSVGFQASVDRAAREDRLVALVVTQPDWCPPCIRLNARWLDNPEDREVSPWLADTMLLEVLGYDEPGSELLRSQGVRFQGTPTLLVYRPVVPGRRLGDSELLGSIVGAPSDYAERLRAIVAGHDPTEGLRARLTRERRPLERARLAHELADLCIARGDANGAVEALREVRGARRARAELSPDEAEELELLALDAEWKRAASVELRVNKNYPVALQGLDAWIARHGRQAKDPQVVAYERAWALAHLGRFEEAREELTAAFLQPGDEDLATFGYFAFRVRHPGLLAEAERLLRAALESRPEEAELQGTLGRVLRAQGRHAEAIPAFTRAVELSEDEARTVWKGQLEWCRAEMRAGSRG